VTQTIWDVDLHINHFFFGASGSMNDLNVLDISPVLSDVCQDFWPPAYELSFHGRPCTSAYYLVGGIYLKYPFLVAAYPIPLTFVERAFNRL